MTELIIGRDVADNIAEVLVEAGLFDEDSAGLLARKPVSTACINRGAKR
ncbi:MAG: hypothetical protein GKR89_20750 [Candidatus Latescibacteria bacterium]|nr:hypothetical protein [Candidatus Latescibacterota bacterium]